MVDASSSFMRKLYSTNPSSAIKEVPKVLKFMVLSGHLYIMVWLECIITAILEYQELYTGRTVHTAQSLKQDKFSTSHQCWSRISL